MITVGEYAGIKGFRNVFNNLELEFHDDNEARNILELARYANVHTQKPLTDSELKFIYYYPNIAAKIMTVNPYYMPQGALKERMEKYENVAGSAIIQGRNMKKLFIDTLGCQMNKSDTERIIGMLSHFGYEKTT